MIKRASNIAAKTILFFEQSYVKFLSKRMIQKWDKLVKSPEIRKVYPGLAAVYIVADYTPSRYYLCFHFPNEFILRKYDAHKFFITWIYPRFSQFSVELAKKYYEFTEWF